MIKNEDTVAIMTPLDPTIDKLSKETYKKNIKSLKMLNYPRNKLHLILIQPEGTDWSQFLEKNHYIDYTLITHSYRSDEIRFFELADFRNALLTEGKIYDWGWFVDSDVLVPRNSIIEFIAYKRDMIGGVVVIPNEFGKSVFGFGKFKPFFNGVKFNNKLPNTVTSVDFINTACMFLSHKIMNDARVKFCVIKSQNQINSEDHSYCFMAKTYGYNIYIDPDIHCKHFRRFSKTEQVLLEIDK